jgi:hypothetical protein
MFAHLVKAIIQKYAIIERKKKGGEVKSIG